MGEKPYSARLTQKGKEILLFSGLKRLLRDQSGYGKGRRRGRLSPAGPACQREGRWGPAVGQIEGERGGARCGPKAKRVERGVLGCGGALGPTVGRCSRCRGGQDWAGWPLLLFFFSFLFQNIFHIEFGVQINSNQKQQA